MDKSAKPKKQTSIEETIDTVQKSCGACFTCPKPRSGVTYWKMPKNNNKGTI